MDLGFEADLELMLELIIAFGYLAYNACFCLVYWSMQT